MKRFALGALLLAAGVMPVLVSSGQPRLVASEIPGYQVGDTIDADMWVVDAQKKKVQLVELFDPEAEVVVLALLGGGASRIPDEPFRGPLWCKDSFDDLGVQRALVAEFKGRPVQLLAVAVPPVFSARFGFEDGVFLNPDEDPAAYQLAVEEFIEATVAAQTSTLIPYEKLFFDPQGLLIRRPEREERDPSWQGKLKWSLDPRKYGLPTLWVLDSSGKVLREPFVGNEYGGDPPSIHYGFQELKNVVEEELNRR